VEGSPEDLRKTTCRGLTGVLKRSPVANVVDPKSFFMMLNSNFAVLAREDGIDLGPVFEALRANAGEEELAALFLQFEQKGEELGIQMILPAPVAALDPEERASLLASARTKSPAPREDSTASLDAEGVDDSGSPSPSSGEQPREGTEGLDEKQRIVVGAIVRGFRDAPGVARVPSGQLNYFIGSRLNEMFSPESKTLQLEILVDALRQAEVADSDIYVGWAFTQANLSSLGVQVPEPNLNVDEEAKAGLVEHAKELRRAQPRPQSVAKARDGSHHARGPTAGPPVAENDKKTLEELGLGQAEQNPRRRQVLRLGMLVGVAAVSGTLGFVFRPTRPLSTSAYEGTVPLKKARLDEGAFQGVIDDAAWARLTPEERKLRFEAFAKLLGDQGRVQGAQVRDESGRLLIAASGSKLRASPQLFKD